MKRKQQQRVRAYVLSWHQPTDPRKEPQGAASFPEATIADMFMHAEDLLKGGYAVTIAPPALASGEIPSAPRNTPALPPSCNVIDLEIVR